MPFFPTTHFPRHHLAPLLRAACIAWLCHWLPSLSLCRLASARVVAGSRRSALLGSRRWLARVVAGLLRWHCWLSRWCSCSALIARRFARPRVASLGLASLARVAGSLLASLAPFSWLASAHISSHRTLLCSHCEPSVTWLRSTCVAGSHRSALFGSHRWLARAIAGLRCWRR